MPILTFARQHGLASVALPVLAGLALAGSVATVSARAPAAPAPSGAQLYTRCAVCHGATGAGVPNAFPPLGADFRAQAATNAGRRYLALVVIKGVSGPLTIGGTTYRGAMPAQSGLDDAAVAAVLNHVGTQIAKTGPAFRAFTAAEVARARASGASLNSAGVAALHH